MLCFDDAVHAGNSNKVASGSGRDPLFHLVNHIGYLEGMHLHTQHPKNSRCSVYFLCFLLTIHCAITLDWTVLVCKNLPDHLQRICFGSHSKLDRICRRK